MRFKYIIPAITLALLTACDASVFLDDEKTAVASVGSEVLYMEDIIANIPDGMSASDSAEFVDKFKQKWITDKLLYSNAVNNVRNTQEINELTESYRKQLLINDYLEQITAQNMPPVTEDSIKSYYNENGQNFKLSETVIQGIFMKVQSSAPDQEKLKRWLKASGSENIEEIMLYCTQHAISENVFLDQWLPLSKLSEQLDNVIEITDNTVSSGVVIKSTDDYNYYLKVTKIAKAGSPQPYEFVKGDITTILTNKAKMEYLNHLNSDLYATALKKGSLKLYEK